MCATCGCDSNGQAIIHDHEHHDHEPSHTHIHDHSHHSTKTVVEVEKDILYQNNLLAERNRGYF